MGPRNHVFDGVHNPQERSTSSIEAFREIRYSIKATALSNTYTMRQKKGTNFLFVCIFSILMIFFLTYIKESISYNSVYLILAFVKNFA